MRVTWVISGLCIVVSMGVCLIVIGQQKMLAMLADQSEELKLKAERLDNGLDDRVYLKEQLEKQLEDERKAVLAFEAEVSKLVTAEEKVKASAETCQADKIKINEELAAMQTERNDTEATFMTERAAWTGEVTALKHTLEQRSAVCDFVKKNATDAQKLCPPKEASPTTVAQPQPPKAAGAPNPK